MKLERLGNITKNLDSRRIPLNSEQRISKSKEGLYPYIGANNIVGYIDEYIFDEKILCVAEDGGNWGANQQCAIIYEGKTWVNNHAHVLVENGKANLEYIKDYLNYSNLNKYIKGATRGKLNKSVLENIQIPLPPLLTQLHIATILSKAENLIAQRKESIRLLDEFLKSTFLEMFGDVDKFKAVPITDLCKSKDDIKCGPFGTQLKNHEYRTEGISLWNITHVNKHFSIPPKEFLTVEKAKELKQYNLITNDIVITRKATVGNAAIYPSHLEEGIMHSDLLRIRLNSDLVNPLVVLYQFHFSNFIDAQVRKFSGGAVTSGINVTKLKMLNVILPDKKLQTQFAQIVEKTEALKTQYQQSLAELENLYGSLSQKAFKGELEMNDPEGV